MARRARFRLTAPKFPVSENDVEEACKTILGMRGYKHERLHAGVFQTLDGSRIIHGAPKGTPDYITAHPRYPGFYLEVKRPGGVLSPEQLIKIEELRQGWRIAVVVVESAAQLAAWLDQHEAQQTRQ